MRGGRSRRGGGRNGWSARAFVERLRHGAPSPRQAVFFLLIFTVCFTVGPILRYCSQHRYFSVRVVEVRGTERLDAAKVRMWLGMVEGRSIWQASPRALEAAVERHPAVARAHVERLFPDRIRVTIRERRARAVLHDPTGFFLLDRSGVAFDEAGAWTGELPIISVDGLPPEITDAPAFVSLVREAVRVAGWFDRGLGGVNVSELVIRPGPELIAYSSDGRLVIRLGWGGFGTKLAALRKVQRYSSSASSELPTAAAAPVAASATKSFARPGLPEKVPAGSFAGSIDLRDPGVVVVRRPGSFDGSRERSRERAA
jgi:cell division protein FtsQ